MRAAPGAKTRPLCFQALFSAAVIPPPLVAVGSRKRQALSSPKKQGEAHPQSPNGTDCCHFVGTNTGTERPSTLHLCSRSSQYPAEVPTIIFPFYRGGNCSSDRLKELSRESKKLSEAPGPLRAI